MIDGIMHTCLLVLSVDNISGRSQSISGDVGTITGRYRRLRPQTKE